MEPFMTEPGNKGVWQQLARAHWGAELALTPLPGEYDLNFQVRGQLDAVLKIMHSDSARADVEMQVALLERLANAGDLAVPKLIKSQRGETIVALQAGDEPPRLAWMITSLPGQLLADVSVRSPQLLSDIGATLAQLHQAMAGFEHPRLERRFKWDMRAADWIRPHLALVGDTRRRGFLQSILDSFASDYGPLLERLPTQAIHNDINDYNLLVEADENGRQFVSGLFDFGDMIACPILADLAIAGAYCIMDTPDPLVSLTALVAGYAAVQAISAEEANALWPLVLTRLAVSVVNCAMMKQERPDDPYVTVSEKPAWAILDRAMNTDSGYAKAVLRKACGHAPAQGSDAVMAFLHARRGSFANVLGMGLADAPRLDLSPAGADSPDNPLGLDLTQIDQRIALHASSGPVIGPYLEPRLIYNQPAFRKGAHPASDRRTVHLGVDIFCAAGTDVHAPLSGQVVFANWCEDDGDYGGVVILQHYIAAGDASFFTLYGHLSKASVESLAVGASLAEGQAFARLGSRAENGHWAPHLHFQLSLQERAAASWPGVASADETDIWQQIFPNPAALLNLADSDAGYAAPDNSLLAAQRARHTVSNLKTSYATPLPIVRGWKQFLFDDQGRTYLDAYNNVPHVGHAHPVVVRAVHAQMRLLSTNTRYLNRTLVDYTKALTARLPDGLDVCFLVNSGSEANDLAIRIARAHSGGKDVFVSSAGYHGITSLNIDISHYKFARLGGGGQADWVHVADVPDIFRGRHRGPDAAAAYATDFEAALRAQVSKGRKIAAFISEPFPSVGGQIVPPAGYLRRVYAAIHAAGGIAIADEVQTGLGRLGRYQWGFEQQDAIPDMVVLGKPLGNGYPIGAVITTRAIADSFANAMEFFSTFGGSTTSCAAGLAVLRVLDEEQLAQNADVTGTYLLQGLRALAKDFPLMADVRGIGLFIGVELMTAEGTPATKAAAQIVNGLRARRILIGSDGPDDNVLKIRPPLCFDTKDADFLLDGLRDVLRQVSRAL
jgi:4-aminobutyrate aminotransferase-like enzyme/Ser/Thr protein kinase RdoA (MazF antagonist)